jgi:hypothetical protein
MVPPMKRFFVILAAAALLATGLPEPAVASEPGAPHYPDLITRPPTNVRLDRGGKGSATGVRRLFFANTIGNIGQGPLELRAENNSTTGTTDAIQEIYTHTGPAGGGGPKGGTAMTLVSSSIVGTFAFHPAHNHWHMDDFAQYELRTINGDGSTGSVVASTDKVSFCMIDTDTINSAIEHFRMGLSHSCGQNARQGIRVGMGDTYSASLPDQFIDVTTVPDGTYRLVSVADPNTAERPGGRLIELNDANNAASVDVVITRTNATIVPGSAQTGVDAPLVAAAEAPAAEVPATDAATTDTATTDTAAEPLSRSAATTATTYICNLGVA